MEKELVIRIALLFYICSIFGYIYETLLGLIYTGKFLHHGYLYGPWLPIYGLGAIIISKLFKEEDNYLKVFFLSFMITGLFEGISGYLILKLLKIRLWDYTGYFLNIGGFVCFLSAFCFGMGSLLINYVIYPLIKKIKINNKINSILSILTTLFVSDLIATELK